MNQAIKSFPADERGGVALITGLTASISVLALGAAMTYGLATETRGSYQRALDAAVLTGAMLPVGATDAERVAASQASFDGALSTQAKNRSASRSAPQFWISNSGTSSVQVNGEASAGVVSLINVAGTETAIKVSAAAKKATSDPICIMALNKSEQGAMDLNGTVNVTTNCPAQANSQDSSAVRAVGNAKMNTAVFAVTGDVRGRNAFMPRPETKAPRVPDPLASTPFPTKGSCHPRSDERIKNNTTLTPGTYCGGIDISSGAVVTLEPGIYIFDGGTFKISGGAQVTGQEVMLALSDSKFWMTGGAIMKVTSPKSGPYMNMQFMEDASVSAGNHWVTIGGDSTLDYDGTMYFPNSNIWIFGGSNVKGKSPDMIMIGDKIWFQDNSVIELTQVNTRGLPMKETPRLKMGAVMVK